MNPFFVGYYPMKAAPVLWSIAIFMQLLDGKWTDVSQSGFFNFIPSIPHTSPMDCGGWLSPSPRLDY
jgi:hypothetical protein